MLTPTHHLCDQHNLCLPSLPLSSAEGPGARTERRGRVETLNDPGLEWRQVATQMGASLQGR